jgi:hypothetical protein
MKSLIIIRLNYYLTSPLTKIETVTRTSQATLTPSWSTKKKIVVDDIFCRFPRRNGAGLYRHIEPVRHRVCVIILFTATSKDHLSTQPRRL